MSSPEPKPQWTEQVAVISGGADGLGLAVARRLGARGVRLVLLDFNRKALDKAKAEFGPSTLTACVDVTDHAAVRQAVDAAATETGRIDILVNCAGITGQTNMKSHEVDPADFDRVMRVNVNGCLNTFQAVLPHMLKRDYGRVLHFASVSGKEGNAGMLAYSTSKAAVIGMTKSLGKELAGHDIAVNALTPATAKTPILDQVSPEFVAYMLSKIPRARFVELDEVVAMALWLISRENSFTTGAVFDLSGGRATY
jgi:3-oxoacyl-[acyl-carrier protein] reductase